MPGGRPPEKYSQALRLLRIWEMLHQRRQVTIPELMQKFGINRRTVQRDIAILTENYSVEEGDRTADNEKTFRITPTQRLEALRLTVLEMIALHMGQNMFAFTTGTPLAEAMESLYEKLNARLSNHDEQLRGMLPRKLYCTAGFPKTYAGSDEVLNQVLTGILHDSKVAVTYRPPRKRAYDDVLHPYTLVVHNHALYVLAHSEHAGALRRLAVERIVEARRLKEPFVYPDDYDPARELGDAFGIGGGEPVRVRLLFDAALAPYVGARQWHPSMTSAPRSDGRLEVTLEVGLTEELLHWITGYGGGVEVLEPMELREQVRERHRLAVAGRA